MKNFNTIYQVVLSIAVLVLFYLHFSKDNAAVVPSVISTDSTGKIVFENKSTVYINGDSLLNNYEYFKKAKKDFEARTKRTENEIVAKRTALEKELMQYQQNGISMSSEQRAKTEENLMRKEQELRMFSENAAAKLQEDQDKFNEALFDKVALYLKEYCKDRNYQVVLNYTKGSTILFASDSLDITSEVLKGLNAQEKD